MKRKTYNEKLEKEKEKLDRLIDEALKNDVPIAQDKSIMEQNRKIDALVVKMQMEKERYRKNRQER